MHAVHAPQPIRTTADNEFAHHTMAHRLPENIRNVISLHPGYPEPVTQAVEALAADIAADRQIPGLRLPAWDADRWDALHHPFAGETWQNTNWFFAETYGFRLLLQAVRFFETRLDPFLPMKQRELDSGSAFLPVQRFFAPDAVGAWIDQDQLTPEERRAVVEEALHLCIWGNKADISFVAGKALDHDVGDRELLVADHGAQAAQLLLGGAGPVHLVTDNAGAELAGDLVLAAVLIRLLGAQVVLHMRFYPTYVSDATVEDLHIFVERALEHQADVVTRFGHRVGELLAEGMLRLAPDPYWCEPRFLDAMPERLAQPLASARMVLVKGDWNYRRAFRDTIWPPETAGAEAMGLSGGAPHIAACGAVPWLFLRTMKSDCIAGVDPQAVTRLDAAEHGWRTAGRRGVIQLVR